jgi:hypothetical protein
MIAIYGSDYPNIPEGYRYDYVSSDVVLNRLSVKDGTLTTKTGMNYKAIYFGKGAQQVTLPVLTKVLEMVKQGAVLIGARPEGSPSLSDDSAKVKEILDTLWPGGDSATVGKGKVFNTNETASALKAIGLEPDFSYDSAAENSNVMFLHRKLNNGGIYFLANQKDQEEKIEASFRISGYKAELWDAATGTISPASYSFDGNRTKVTVPLDRFGSVFVVFREPTKAKSLIIPAPKSQTVAELSGPWKVDFQPNRGAPASATFDKLTDFRDNADPGIRYFSGIATYTKEVQLPAQNVSNEQLWLDLGLVNNLAEVWVNGKLAGTAWKPPYRVNITDFVTKGSNKVEIKSVNTWVNRLIGDAQPGVTEKVTLTTRAFYKADSPLKPSGLIGPVQVISLSKN